MAKLQTERIKGLLSVQNVTLNKRHLKQLFFLFMPVNLGFTVERLNRGIQSFLKIHLVLPPS